MNWKRISVFALAVNLATVVVGFVSGFLGSLVQAASGAALPLLPLFQALAAWITVVACFAVLGHMQRDRTILHGAVGFLGAWLTSLPLGLLMKQSALTWIISIIPWLVSASIGLGIGVLARGSKAAS